MGSVQPGEGHGVPEALSVLEAARRKRLMRKTLHTGENGSGFPLQTDAA